MQQRSFSPKGKIESITREDGYRAEVNRCTSIYLGYSGFNIHPINILVIFFFLFLILHPNVMYKLIWSEILTYRLRNQKRNKLFFDNAECFLKRNSNNLKIKKEKPIQAYLPSQNIFAYYTQKQANEIVNYYKVPVEITFVGWSIERYGFGERDVLIRNTH